MNNQLRSLYLSKWDELSSVINSTEDLSTPILINVPPGYSKADVKLLIVGQQTHGWYETQSDEHPVDELMQNYASFALGKSRMNTPFWQASHKIHEQLNPDAPRAGFVWTNLVRADQDKSRPSQSVEEEICNLNLLPGEVEIVAPDAVVFFTGPNYVERLRCTFEGMDRKEVADNIYQIDHSLLPVNSFQTYHPNYLRRSGNWDVIDQIVELVD